MKDSRISWTDHTFNPWIGCARVSAGCQNCYAEAQDQRWRGGVNWGANAERQITSDAYWRQPLKWNRDAEAEGVKLFVFCASLADVFEDRDDLVEPRARLFDLIERTPNLVWLLLTKRPENVLHLTDDRWPLWPDNVWVGATVESQTVAIDRISALARVTGASVRFLSCEPLIGPVSIERAVMDFLTVAQADRYPNIRDLVNWVIVGGESGPGHRPMNLDWARGLVDQCAALRIPAWFKQVGGTIKIDGEWGGNRLDGEIIHERPEP